MFRFSAFTREVNRLQGKVERMDSPESRYQGASEHTARDNLSPDSLASGVLFVQGREGRESNAGASSPGHKRPPLFPASNTYPITYPNSIAQGVLFVQQRDESTSSESVKKPVAKKMTRQNSRTAPSSPDHSSSVPVQITKVDIVHIAEVDSLPRRVRSRSCGDLDEFLSDDILKTGDAEVQHSGTLRLRKPSAEPDL
eukprot:TRINITY_DN27443_c0_g1_i1.p1 TRINITY_DN27443_c0_g1~~TRINITY_DN27443_c0_g1_i1.p1  ORF type:complete len:198 (+),score=13.45 TRINITY_DN27443_c0_g1_i1:151-744(+)